ncbi:hypothetical protein ISF_01030 [Cordyceps fumosorosea ARSEF 2679]|uniref:Uncharacterized protein n=1 Tax=Cordyceps fumosorosea (strain ARSEF 2679) TaxID=1081104 RepID=A0A162N1T5_CORFA|nr:hypothetical protein ISF_01030 [Cordyceps fumosorosea ARSEF 2679]OAA74129.1 hypothetical protein ISF_01030 [Cordyceps fumosorosea ARSEF 2679]
MYDYKAPIEGVYQPQPQPRSSCKATAIKVATAFGALALVGIAGVAVASRCRFAVGHQAPVIVDAAEFREQLPAVLRRENADESIPGLQPYDYSTPVGPVVVSSGSVVSGGAAARATGEDELGATSLPANASVPTLTQTRLNTAYRGVRSMEANTTRTSTTTLTTTVVITPGATTRTCDSSPDETETVTTTVTVVPEPSYAPETYGTPAAVDVTVTGDPATVTDVQTDTSFTSGAPDVTVSGTPVTVTDVLTDTSFTSGAPDATVSGSPATVTTVITNTAGEPLTTLTFTSVNTVFVTVTTVTRTRGSTTSVDFDSSVLGLPHSSATDDGVVTHTETVTVTGGPPVTSTTTVVLPPTYGSAAGGGHLTSYGTGVPINATAMPTYIPPIVSAGAAEGCGRSWAYLVLAVGAAMHLF